MTKQEVTRSINRLYPGAILLNSRQVAALFGKHENYAPKITREIPCVKREKSNKLYFIDDIAELVVRYSCREGGCAN